MLLFKLLFQSVKARAKRFGSDLRARPRLVFVHAPPYLVDNPRKITFLEFHRGGLQRVFCAPFFVCREELAFLRLIEVVPLAALSVRVVRRAQQRVLAQRDATLFQRGTRGSGRDSHYFHDELVASFALLAHVGQVARSHLRRGQEALCENAEVLRRREVLDYDNVPCEIREGCRAEELLRERVVLHVPDEARNVTRRKLAEIAHSIQSSAQRMYPILDEGKFAVYERVGPVVFRRGRVQHEVDGVLLL